METFEFEGKHYVATDNKDLKVGDVVINKAWFGYGLKGILDSGYHYLIIGNDGRRLQTIEFRSKDHPNPYTFNWTYADFGRDWFVEGFKELQYDPTQQGDCEDDI